MPRCTEGIIPPPYDKLKLDLTYIENYSFFLDCKLILLTFKILFQKENTEGVEQWQVTAATKEKRKRQRDEKINSETRQKIRALGGKFMEQPKVSVIIPAYRCAGTLAGAVRSALIQQVPLEVLVIDDCSGENLEDVLAPFASEPVFCLKNEKNVGAAASRNRGVQAARGEYVAFLDADDWWEAGKLKKQLKRMEETGLRPLRYGQRACDTGGKAYRQGDSGAGYDYLPDDAGTESDQLFFCFDQDRGGQSFSYGT